MNCRPSFLHSPCLSLFLPFLFFFDSVNSEAASARRWFFLSPLQASFPFLKAPLSPFFFTTGAVEAQLEGWHFFSPLPLLLQVKPFLSSLFQRRKGREVTFFSFFFLAMALSIPPKSFFLFFWSRPGERELCERQIIFLFFFFLFPITPMFFAAFFPPQPLAEMINGFFPCTVFLFLLSSVFMTPQYSNSFLTIAIDAIIVRGL